MTLPTYKNPYPAVTLVDDRAFRGFAFGRLIDADGNDTGQIVVSVAQPGQSDLHGCVRLPAERLEVLD